MQWNPDAHPWTLLAGLAIGAAISIAYAYAVVWALQ